MVEQVDPEFPAATTIMMPAGLRPSTLLAECSANSLAGASPGIGLHLALTGIAVRHATHR